MDAGAPEGFNVVDVPHPSDAALVQQQWLDRGPATLLQEIAQPAGREARRQRLDAEHAVQRVTRAGTRSVAILQQIRALDDRHAPELAGVAEAQGRAVGER